MERRRKKSGKATSESYSEFVHDIGQLILNAQELARQHGLFPNNREFLKCRKCGLLEGVDFEGRLMTCYLGAEDINTGLRFIESDENSVSKCPKCGKKVKCNWL
jgi:hypothetical protein